MLRKILIGISILFLVFESEQHFPIPQIAWASTPIALVANTAQDSLNSGSTSGNRTLTINNVVDGSFLIVTWDWSNAGVTTTISDSNGTCTALYTNQLYNGTAGHTSVCYEANAASGTHTFTFTYSGTYSYPTEFAINYTGVSLTSPVDSNNLATGSSTALNSGNATPTVGNDGFWCYGNITGTAPTAGATYTIRTPNSANSSRQEDNTPSLITRGTAKAGTMTSVSNTAWIAIVIAMRPAFTTQQLLFDMFVKSMPNWMFYALPS